MYAEDFSVHGFQAEFNWPSQEFRGENFETDFFAEFIQEGVSIPDWDRDVSLLHVGFRTYKHLANLKFRPYLGLGVGVIGSTEVYHGRQYKDFGSLVSVRAGLEADLAARLTSRHEIKLWLNETGYSRVRYNGSLLFGLPEILFFAPGSNLPTVASIARSWISGSVDRFSVSLN